MGGEKRAALRVLIAEDNRDAMLTLGILVRSEGYIVKLTENGKQALAVAPYFEPDIVLLDLAMPEVSGFDVAEELMQRYGAQCPVMIAVSAQQQEEDRRRYREGDDSSRDAREACRRERHRLGGQSGAVQALLSRRDREVARRGEAGQLEARIITYLVRN